MSSSSDFDSDSHPSSPIAFDLQAATDYKSIGAPGVIAVDSKSSGYEASAGISVARVPSNPQATPIQVSYRADANIPAPQLPASVRAGVTFQSDYKPPQAFADPIQSNPGGSLPSLQRPTSQVQVTGPAGAEASKQPEPTGFEGYQSKPATGVSFQQSGPKAFDAGLPGPKPYEFSLSQPKDFEVKASGPKTYEPSQPAEIRQHTEVSSQGPKPFDFNSAGPKPFDVRLSELKPIDASSTGPRQFDVSSTGPKPYDHSQVKAPELSLPKPNVQLNPYSGSPSQPNPNFGSSPQPVAYSVGASQLNPNSGNPSQPNPNAAISSQPKPLFPPQFPPQFQQPEQNKPFQANPNISIKSENPIIANKQEPDSSSKIDQKSEYHDNADEKFLCLKIRLWHFIFLGLMAFLLILIIGCLATPRWVYQGDSDTEIIGGLLVCYNCPGDLDGETYASIIKNDDFCDNSNLDGLCDTIKKLQGAGGAYLAFSLFTVVVLLVWTTYFILHILKKNFPGPKWIPYLFPLLSLILNFLAIAAWGGASEAKYRDKDKCDVISTADEEDICATDGPGLALLIFLFLIFYSVLFGIYYFMTTRQKKQEDDDPNSIALKKSPKHEDRV